MQEDRPVTNFTSVEADGFMNVYLTQGTTCKVSLEGESNILEYIKTRVEGEKLIVSTLHNINLSTTKKLNIYVTLAQLKEITLAGSGDIIGKTPLTSTDGIKFSLAGSGNIRAEVDAPTLESTLAGSGDMSLHGTTRDVKVMIAGSADFKSLNLKAENGDVTIMGSGSAYLFASVKLNVTIGGSGDVIYKGDPSISSHIAGSGSLRKSD